MGSLEHISAPTAEKTLHRPSETQNRAGPPPNREVEWPSDALVVARAVLDPPLGASTVSCAAHKLQAVVFLYILLRDEAPRQNPQCGLRSVVEVASEIYQAL